MLNNMYWPVYKNLEKEVLELSYNIYFDDMQFEYVKSENGDFTKTPPYSLKVGDLLMRCCTEIEALIIQMTSEHNQEIRLADTNKKPIEQGDKIPIGCRQKWLCRHLDLDKKIVKVSCTSMFFKKSDNRFFAPLSYKPKDEVNDFIAAYNAIKHNRDERTAWKGNIRFLLRALAALFLLNIYYKNEEWLPEFIWDRPHDVSLGSEIFSLDIRDLTHFDEKLPYSTGKDYPNSVYLRKLSKDSLLEEAEEDFAQKKDYYVKRKEILTSSIELQDFFRSGHKVPGTPEYIIFRAAGEYLANKMNELHTYSDKVNFIISRPHYIATKIGIAQTLKQIYPSQEVDFDNEEITPANINSVCIAFGALEFQACARLRILCEGTELLKDYEASGGKYDIEHILQAQLQLGKPLVAEMNKLDKLADKVRLIKKNPAYRMLEKSPSMLLELYYPNLKFDFKHDDITYENVEAICLLVGSYDQIQKLTDALTGKAGMNAMKNQPKFPRRSVVILNKGQPLYKDVVLPADRIWDE